MPGTPARIHRALVTRVEALGPGLIRVTLGGGDLTDYPTTGSPDAYVRLFLPDAPDGEPWRPRVHGRGLGVRRRRRTVPDAHPRHPRAPAGEVDIDFVRHDDGLAAEWAGAVLPGGAVGISRPFAQFTVDP
ncbi:siderophore-interacting protein [Streptomyces sp. NPDC127068]|uniref:siderophore-interacting protein n=1 Tax=Streptomyces sp. NPDC127068 TaxID=3347127 RepID=UPI00365A0936